MHPVAAPLVPSRVRLPFRLQSDLPLPQLAIDPDQLVPAHNGVHRVALAQERLPIGARHLGPREVVPAALPLGMAVNDPYGPCPPGVLTGLSRDDVGGGRLRRLDVRRADPAHEYRLPPDLADHAPHELSRIGAVL